MTYLFCAYRPWALELFEKIEKKYNNFVLLKNRKKLTFNYVRSLKPKYIFFPDWSWMVPEDIISNFNCICFHESDLPKFRGGSPIQNQIIRGIKKTKSTAFIMTKSLDKGNILLKKNLSLEGTLNEIFERIIKNDYEMIQQILKGNYKKRKQVGKVTIFKRRKPTESELKNLNYSKRYLYNFIRMLADPYPNAFIKIGKRKIIFQSAKYNGKKLEIKGEID